MRTQMAAAALAAAAALSAGLSTTASSAATAATWTVTPGGSTGGSGPGTLKDTTAGTTVFTCTALGLSLLFKSGSGLTNPLASISALRVSGCPTTVTITAGGLPWQLNGSSYDASTGVTTGTISGIDMRITEPGCSVTADGTAAGADNGRATIHYANATGKLKIGPGGSLRLWAVSGCLGMFHTGDRAALTDTITLTPHEHITSP